MPLLRNNEKNLRRTKRGKVICKSSEVYKRNDIGCGSLICKECVYIQPLKPTLSNNVYIIPTTLTVKHQMDIITSPAFLSKFNVILLQSMIEDLKEESYALYKRLETEISQCHEHKAPIYIFMNNLNKDTSIRSAVKCDEVQLVKCYKWYDTHLSLHCPSSFHLFIITDSAKSVQLLHSVNADVKAISMEVLVTSLFPNDLSNLQDSLSCAVASDDSGTGADTFYKAHWKMNRVTSDLNSNATTVLKGKYQSVRGFGSNAFGKVRVNSNTIAKEIFIRGLNNINRAIHDDIVIVQLANSNSNEGRIVAVIEANWRAYCGSLEERESGARGNNKILFVPIDARIPKIKIMSSQILNLMNKRIIVHIDEWRVNDKYPSGHYTETIGVIGDLETETQCLLLEHDIPYDPWSDAVLKCLPQSKRVELDASEREKRRNLIESEGGESVTIFSVDPPGCVDIDDALHCKELVNGNIEVGVHIADVAHYVEANSALDREAAKRGTSVYLVDRRIDMLPSLLSTDLCSLKPKQKRLSFSVFWELKIGGKAIEIVNTWFGRCIMRSVAALSYQEAQSIIDDEKNNSEMAKSLRNLLFISKLLKEERSKRGALSLSSLKPSFKFKKNVPHRIESYKTYATNSMIEEFMLFANISVAQKILNAFPSFAMLRRHPKPNNEMLSPLTKCAAIRGFKINTQNSKQLSLSLDKCVDANDKSFNDLIRIITTRCMTQAVYFISGSVANKKDYNHYGLASPIYTHFTSPIRRYADIIVHRQLAHCCGYRPFQNTHNMQSIIQDIVHSLNRRHRMAQYINRASSNLYTLMYFDNINTPITCSAIISQIDTNCLNVFISKYCMERRIYLNHKHEWKFDSVQLTLCKISPPAVKYQIFDKVAVSIYVTTSKYHRKNLIVELIDNHFNKNLTQENQIDVPVLYQAD